MIKTNKLSFKFSSQPANQSTRKLFLVYLKTLIFLSPLPFGCVGKIWSPLFYLLLTILTYIGFKVEEIEDRRQKIEDRSQKIEDRKFEADTFTQNSKFKTQNLEMGEGQEVDEGFKVQGSRFNVKNIKNILYEKWIKGLFIALLLFIGLQIIPLPTFLVKIISAKKIEVLYQLVDELPAFTSLSMVPFETLIYGLIVVLYGLFFWILSRIQLRKREMVGLFNTLVLCASIQVIFGLFKYAQGNTHFFLFFHPLEKSDFSRFLTGTLGNPNHFAFFLEMVLPLSLALFFFRLRFFETNISFREKFLSIMDENKIIILYFISISIMGIGIILTGSRAGIVTVILLFIIFTLLSVYLKQSQDIRKRIKWFLLAVTCLAVYFGIQNTVAKFAQLGVVEGGRFRRWPDTISMVADYPILGTGFGTYRYSFYLYDSQAGAWSTHAHNDLLEILADGGVVGGILFYSLVGIIILSITRMWWKRHHPDVKILGLGILVSFFAVIFHSFFDFSLRIPSNMFVFILVLVLGLKIVHFERRDLPK